MAKEHEDAGRGEPIPLFNRRCEFCSGIPGRTFHGKCTDPYGSNGECSCHMFEEGHRYQWSRDRWSDLAHDVAKDGDDGLPHDKVIRSWEEDRQRHEDRIMVRD